MWSVWIFSKKLKDVYDRFFIENTLENFKSRWNIKPGELNPVIVNHEKKEIKLMFWGILLHFVEDEHYKYKVINAKAKIVDKLPTFRQSFLHKRC